jgi:serine/threonine-protein kinase
MDETMGNRDEAADPGGANGARRGTLAWEGSKPAVDLSLQATIAASTILPQQGAPASPGSPKETSPIRSTVLPRVQIVGDRPELVSREKARYETTRRLGEGAMGEVLGADDNDIGRPVALKRLRPELGSPAMLARFVEEIRTVGGLEHPNIVPIHDVGVDAGGEYYFVMKYVDGETLESIIEKLAAGDRDYHARFPFARRVEVFKGILEALAFAHARGVIHRDIKPANVMVGRFGEVVLMDWGIAKRIRGGDGVALDISTSSTAASAPAIATERAAGFATQVGSLIGTPAYMSPEQARGEPADERSDVYALCVLFYELLSLRHPLADKNNIAEVLAGAINEKPRAAGFVSTPHQPLVPADLSWFVDKGLQKDPSQRYPSVRAMIDRLDRRAEGDIPVQCPVTFMKRTVNELTRLIDRHPTFVMIAAAIFLLSGIAGAVWGIALS